MPLTVNFAHLRAFHAVAVELSVSRAAQRLGVSQPTLSAQIKALAQRHKVALFARDGARLRLTPFGSNLLVATTQLMENLAVVEGMLGGAVDTQIGGHLRIGADGPGHAATVLVEFQRCFPLPLVSMTVANATLTLQKLINAEVDVAFVGDPLVHTGLVYLPIGFDSLRLVCSASHPFAALSRIPVARLAEEALVLREPGSRTREMVTRLLVDAGVTPARVVEIGTREASREVVARGLGVALLVSSECGDDKRLVTRPIDAEARRYGITEYVVYAEAQRRQPIIRAFVDIATIYAKGWSEMERQ